jgi:uncharacterized protein YbjT (DUF2867 family)
MILITGAAGMNGLAVIREFGRNKARVRALVRSREKAKILAGLPAADVIEGDMLRPGTLGPALDGVERVLMISSANPQMVETQCSFIDSCKKARVRHIIKFSGAESGIGFDPKKFRFTRMHEEIEDYLEGSGLAWTHLRPSQFMQVYLREAPTIVAKGLFLLPLEDAKLSPVDIEDIAKIAFAIVVHGGYEARAFDITGPEALNMSEIAIRIGDAIGKLVHYENVTPEERRLALTAAGLPPFMLDALDEQAAERRRHPESRIELATHELFGVKPTTFSEFVRHNAALFRAGT